jgi:hypothetical protein
MAYVVENVDSTATSATNDDGNSVSISGTEEVGQGLTVTGTFVLESDQSTLQDDGSTIKIANDMGSLTLGGPSGAADSVGDYTDVAAWYGGFGADGQDHFALISVSPVAGLTINASYSPNTTSNVATGAPQGDVHGYSAKYAFGSGEVYYANETDRSEADEIGFTAMGVKYTFGGITVAYEQASEEVRVADQGTTATAFSGLKDSVTAYTHNSDDLDWTGLALKYAMGDVTFAYENQKLEQGTTELKDATVFSANYAIGALNAFVSTQSNDTTSIDSTAFGVKYAF